MNLGRLSRFFRHYGVGLKKRYPFVYLLPKTTLRKLELKGLLPKSLLKMTSWEVPESEVEGLADSNEIYSLWSREPGGHKLLHYFDFYERVFSQQRAQQNLRILEIGVYNGASLRMWRKYFQNAEVVCGIDLNPNCIEHADPEKGIAVCIGNQADTEFLKEVVSEHGPFDIIIDDGSHITSHIFESFGFLFSQGLKDKGTYLIEDTHTNYWGSCRSTMTSIPLWIAYLVDIMHYHYGDMTSNLPMLEDSPERQRQFKVPEITTCLESIEATDSIITLRKNASKLPPISRHL